MANPIKVYPYAKGLNYKEGKQVILGEKKFSCQYRTIRDVTGSETSNCIGPKYKAPGKKYFALCEKTV